MHAPSPNKKTTTKTWLLPATEPLGITSSDIVGSLPKKKSGSQYIVVMKDRFLKFTQEILTIKTTAKTVAKMFLEH